MQFTAEVVNGGFPELVATDDGKVVDRCKLLLALGGDLAALSRDLNRGRKGAAERNIIFQNTVFRLILIIDDEDDDFVLLLRGEQLTDATSGHFTKLLRTCSRRGPEEWQTPAPIWGRSNGTNINRDRKVITVASIWDSAFRSFRPGLLGYDANSSALRFMPLYRRDSHGQLLWPFANGRDYLDLEFLGVQFELDVRDSNYPGGFRITGPLVSSPFTRSKRMRAETAYFVPTDDPGTNAQCWVIGATRTRSSPRELIVEELDGEMRD